MPESHGCGDRTIYWEAGASTADLKIVRFLCHEISSLPHGHMAYGRRTIFCGLPGVHNRTRPAEERAGAARYRTAATQYRTASVRSQLKSYGRRAYAARLPQIKEQFMSKYDFVSTRF